MMSSIRSSRTVAVVVIAVLLGAAGTAAALSLSADGIPGEAESGTEENATITIDDAYTEDSEWTLETETELENVSWTVEEYDQGSRVNQWSDGGQSFSQALSSDPEGDEIRIEVRGEVPAVGEYNYDPEENFTMVEIKRTTGDNTETLERYDVHHYDNESKNAREMIEEAEDAIDEAGGDQQAERSLQQAISAYNNGNFNNAISNAQDAKQAAQQQQQSQQTNRLLLFGGIGAVVLLLIIGGIYYYRQQGDDYDKLR